MSSAEPAPPRPAPTEASSRFEAGLRQLAETGPSRHARAPSSCPAQHGSVATTDWDDEEAEGGRAGDVPSRGDWAHLGALFFFAAGACLEGGGALEERLAFMAEELEAADYDARARGRTPIVSTTRCVDADDYNSCVGPQVPRMRDPTPIEREAEADLEYVCGVIAPRMSIGGAGDWDSGVVEGAADVGSLDGPRLDRFVDSFRLRVPGGPLEARGAGRDFGSSPPDVHGTDESPRADGSLASLGARGDWFRGCPLAPGAIHQAGARDMEERPRGTWAGRLWEVVSIVFLCVVGWAACERCPVCARYAAAAMAVTAIVAALAVGAAVGMQPEREGLAEEEALMVRGESPMRGASNKEWRDVVRQDGEAGGAASTMYKTVMTGRPLSR